MNLKKRKKKVRAKDSAYLKTKYPLKRSHSGIENVIQKFLESISRPNVTK